MKWIGCLWNLFKYRLTAVRNGPDALYIEAFWGLELNNNRNLLTANTLKNIFKDFCSLEEFQICKIMGALKLINFSQYFYCELSFYLSSLCNYEKLYHWTFTAYFIDKLLSQILHRATQSILFRLNVPAISAVVLLLIPMLNIALEICHQTFSKNNLGKNRPSHSYFMHQFTCCFLRLHNVFSETSSDFYFFTFLQ